METVASTNNNAEKITAKGTRTYQTAGDKTDAVEVRLEIRPYINQQ